MDKESAQYAEAIGPIRLEAEKRRLLRDKIGDHEIRFGGTGLDLGDHNERDEA